MVMVMVMLVKLVVRSATVVEKGMEVVRFHGKEILVSTAHCKTLLYRPLYKFAASGGKLKPLLAKKLLCFLAWIKVASLQDIAVNGEGGKFLQKCDLQY